MKILKDMELHFVRSAKIRGESLDPRRAQERADFEMVSEDPREIANLPRRFQSREFPKKAGLFSPEWE